MSYINVSKDPQKKLKNGYFISTILGLYETTKVFVKQILKIENNVTVQWPEAVHKYSDRFKGSHFLTKRPDGKVRCTACFLCATNCPAQCITIIAGQSEDINIEKFPLRFEIDILRCVFCGYCEEACPVDAIRLGPEYSMAGLVGERQWIHTKDYLLNRQAIRDQIGNKQYSKKDSNLNLYQKKDSLEI